MKQETRDKLTLVIGSTVVLAAIGIIVVGIRAQLNSVPIDAVETTVGIINGIVKKFN